MFPSSSCTSQNTIVSEFFPFGVFSGIETITERTSFASGRNIRSFQPAHLVCESLNSLPKS